MAKPTIVLIHGLWMTPESWENWTSYYESKGHKVVAPAWPGVEAGIEKLRTNPSLLAGLGVTEIVDHYEKIIRNESAQTIIMGHSFGALITQILLDRGVGTAGIAISSAPPKGVLKLPFSSLRVGSVALRNPANLHKAKALTRKQFHYAFCNTLSKQQSDDVYDRYQIPGPMRPLFQAALAAFTPHAATTINFKNHNRAPLLIINGEKDHISPPAIGKSIHKLQSKSGATTDYKEFPGRSHYILGQDGWQEIANYALTWINANVKDSQ